VLSATRAEAFVVKEGTYAYGSYPDIDALFAEQATEMDRAKRTALLHRLQQLVHEKSIFDPNLAERPPPRSWPEGRPVRLRIDQGLSLYSAV
jgi:hypothetical protein